MKHSTACNPRITTSLPPLPPHPPTPLYSSSPVPLWCCAFAHISKSSPLTTRHPAMNVVELALKGGSYAVLSSSARSSRRLKLRTEYRCARHPTLSVALSPSTFSSPRLSTSPRRGVVGGAGLATLPVPVTSTRSCSGPEALSLLVQAVRIFCRVERTCPRESRWGGRREGGEGGEGGHVYATPEYMPGMYLRSASQ